MGTFRCVWTVETGLLTHFVNKICKSKVHTAASAPRAVLSAQNVQGLMGSGGVVCSV